MGHGDRIGWAIAFELDVSSFELVARYFELVASSIELP